MSRIAPIFRKDVRHLWPQILAFLATLIAFACMDPTYTITEPGSEHTILLGALLPVSCWLLVTCLFQEERTVGSDAYWLTRPFTPTDLLIEKALFLFAFVTVPVFIVQAIVLDEHHLPPSEHLGDLIIRNMFLASWLLLPFAAIATVTARITRALLATLMLIIPAWLAAGFRFAPRNAPTWLSLSVTAFLLLAGSSAVVLLQFTQRRTAGSRRLLAASVAASLAPHFLAGMWTTSVQSWYWEHNANAQALHVALDPEPRPSPCEYPEYCIPVRVDRLPRGVFAIPQWSTVATVGGVGFEWRQVRVNADPPLDWLVPSDVSRVSHRLQTLQSSQIHIKGTVALSLAKPIPFFRPECRTKPPFMPYSPSPWFGPIESCQSEYAYHAIGYVQRSFDLGPLRLADYAVKK